ncbi:MAG: hypothetical protein HC880_01155 [Bacteroidia bacterium]|nr:hypothetical protein [Bacteroidia bacterium]
MQVFRIKQAMIWSLASLLGCHIPLQAQEIVFKPLSVREGLSQNNVLAITQDHQGYMWFGTLNGLNKFNGYSVEVFKYQSHDRSSLSNNHITSLLSDSRGYLWVGTSDGLNVQKSGQSGFTRITHLNDPDPSIRAYVIAIHEDTHHNIWILVEKTDLALYRLAQGKTVFEKVARLDYLPERAYLPNYGAICQSSEQHLWIGTVKNGLHCYNPIKKKFMALPSDLTALKINTLASTPLASLWIGTHGQGLYHYFPQHQLYRHYQHDPKNPESLSDDEIHDLLLSKHGGLWIATDKGGINHYRYEGKFKKYYLSEIYNSTPREPLRSLYESQSGVVWAGTIFGGLWTYDPHQTGFKTIRNIPGKKILLAITS